MLQILHLGTARCWQNLLPMGIEARPGLEITAPGRGSAVFFDPMKGGERGGGETSVPGPRMTQLCAAGL